MLNIRRVVILLVAILVGSTAAAQDVGTVNFWDQHQRLAKPALPTLERIRFLTSVDYPPFNFLDARGRLGGFNVDLVQAACEELGLIDRCQIEARPFADLVPALLRGEGEAVVAGVAVTAPNRATLAFTESYFRYPARFVTRKDRPLAEPLAFSSTGKKVGVVDGSAHVAMLATFFPMAARVAFDNRELALEALRKGDVDAVFGDGVGLSFWLESEAADRCCSFSGGPYLSQRFLGEGLAIAVARKNADLAKALDYGIGQVIAKRRFSELMLRYFPVSAF
ncbi:amino acid ABC transporter [Aureimonas sp. SA4125]|uniref:transporter substrate-binding domain-containing protein n=1 Tax=Aureimonas sp. SA4125 TaxID=2826993 RepID=UPI001CC75BF5|nr:transporter substrate-binding domain-containing protein [Aureimonas sp. SA4125]BDA83178.1 amino acid ABC transporter [Aureimonas sp. SA4125]